MLPTTEVVRAQLWLQTQSTFIPLCDQTYSTGRRTLFELERRVSVG